jgi:hypothetical protein
MLALFPSLLGLPRLDGHEYQGCIQMRCLQARVEELEQRHPALEVRNQALETENKRLKALLNEKGATKIGQAPAFKENDSVGPDTPPQWMTVNSGIRNHATLSPTRSTANNSPATN